jgi:hypothetical protein
MLRLLASQHFTHDPQYLDTQYNWQNGTQHSDTQCNDTQHFDTQQKYTQFNYFQHKIWVYTVLPILLLC